MVAAGGIEVYLLQQTEVSLLLPQKVRDLPHILRQPFLAPRPGLSTAVHKKAIVVLIGAEADVVGDHRIGLPCRDRTVSLSLRCQRHITQPMVGDQYIGHIGTHQQYQRQHHAQYDFYPTLHLSHRVILPIYKVQQIYYNVSIPI